MSEVTLHVAEAIQNDVGRGVVRLDTKTRESLGISTGDIVEILGKRTTGAVVWRAYTEDEGSDIVRMDSIIRQNAGISLDDKVKIKKSKILDAEKVVFAPTQSIRFAGDFGNSVRRSLLGRPFTQEDKIVLGVLGNTLYFRVVKTLPQDIVKIVQTTEVEILDKPFNIKDSMKSVKSLIADLVKYGADATEAGDLLQNAKTTANTDISLAMEFLEKATEEANRIKQESKPDLSLKIINDNIQLDVWNKVNIELINSGNANAKDIKIGLIVPDANIRGIKKILVQKPNEKRNLEVGIKPFDAGNLPLEVNVTYLDFDGTKYEYEDSFWIKVSDPKTRKIRVKETHCITGGMCNQEIKLNEKQYFVGHSFTQQNKEDLRIAIENALKKFDLQPYYADQEVRRGTILCKICKKIRSTRLGIYEISDQNPNVMIELGIGLGFGIPILLIAKENSNIPTDINNLDRIEYTSFNKLTEELRVKIKKFIS